MLGRLGCQRHGLSRIIIRSLWLVVSSKQASVDQEAAVDVDPVLHRVPEVEVGLLDQHRAEGS